LREAKARLGQARRGEAVAWQCAAQKWYGMVLSREAKARRGVAMKGNGMVVSSKAMQW
jgi:hypothetical protein